jgi:hypothetical protein
VSNPPTPPNVRRRRRRGSALVLLPPLIQPVTRTRRRTNIPMRQTVQLLTEMPVRIRSNHQNRIQRSLRHRTTPITHVADCYTRRVMPPRMPALRAPAATLEDGTVIPHAEVVRVVGPAVRILMLPLDTAHRLLPRRIDACGMVEEERHGLRRLQCHPRLRWPCTPLLTGHEVHSGYSGAGVLPNAIHQPAASTPRSSSHRSTE